MKVFKKETNEYLGEYFNTVSNTFYIGNGEEKILTTSVFILYITDNGEVYYENNHEVILKEE